jgi:hypothetical protein
MAISHMSYSWTLNMEATRPETSAHFKQHAGRCIPEDRAPDIGEFCCSLRLKAAPYSMCVSRSFRRNLHRRGASYILSRTAESNISTTRRKGAQLCRLTGDALNGWPASRLGRFTPCTHWFGGYGGGDVQERKFLPLEGLDRSRKPKLRS